MLDQSSGINIITDPPIFIKMMATALPKVNFIEKPLTHIQMGPIPCYIDTWVALRVPVGIVGFTFCGINNIAGTYSGSEGLTRVIKVV